MKEIAKVAGVSHGTVSNVLAKKGNVSVEKIRLVEEAVRKLDYSKNDQAQNLRKESVNHVAIILPNIQLEKYNHFYSSLVELLEELEYSTSLYITKSLLSSEKKALDSAISKRAKYIVLFSCSNNPAQVQNSSAKIIYLGKPILESTAKELCVSFDYSYVAEEIFGHLKTKNWKKIAFFGDIKNNPADGKLSLLLGEKFIESNSVFLPIESSQSFIYNRAIEIIRHAPPFDLVICADEKRRQTIENFSDITNTECPAIFTIESQKTLSSTAKNHYCLDYRRLAYETFKIIEGDSNGETMSAVLVKPTPDARKINIKKGRKISLLTLNSPTSEALYHLTPYFKKSTGIDLKIISLPYDELFKTLSLPFPAQYDFLRMDILWTNMFQKRLLSPINELPPVFEQISERFYPPIAKAYKRETGNAYTLPLDPSVQMLFYRKDLFEDIEVRRSFYEKYKRQMRVPETFKEHDRISKFFTKQFNPNSPVDYGITMTYGSASVAVNDFMPRVRDYLHAAVSDGRASPFNATPFREALESYVKSRNYASGDANKWWAESVSSFANGNSATTIAYANHASRILNNQQSSIVGKVGTAVVPNKSPLLGGGCLGVSSNSENKQECAEFINWVYSDEIANLIVLLGGFSPCDSVYKNEEILSLYPWLRKIGPHFDVASRLYDNKQTCEFNDNYFEHIIGIEVRNVLMEVSSIDEAIERMNVLYNQEFNNSFAAESNY